MQSVNNVTLSNENYDDFVGSLYYKALGVQNLKFSPKVVKATAENKLDRDTVMVHIEGLMPEVYGADGSLVAGGLLVNTDMWPRDDAKAEEIKALPTFFDDIIIRVGYWPDALEKDAKGNPVLKAYPPKFVGYISGGKRYEFSGGNRWENAHPAQKSE